MRIVRAASKGVEPKKNHQREKDLFHVQFLFEIQLIEDQMRPIKALPVRSVGVKNQLERRRHAFPDFAMSWDRCLH